MPKLVHASARVKRLMKGLVSFTVEGWASSTTAWKGPSLSLGQVLTVQGHEDATLAVDSRKGFRIVHVELPEGYVTVGKARDVNPFEALSFASGLEGAPSKNLQSYLVLLGDLLTEIAILERSGSFRQTSIAKKEIAPLAKEAKRLAEAGFDHALTVRPGTVDYWLRSIVAVPKAIDLVAWKRRAAKATKAAKANGPALPPPSAALKKALRALVKHDAHELAPATPAEVISAVLAKAKTKFPRELVELFQLTEHLQVSLGVWQLSIARLDPWSAYHDFAVSLMGAGKNPQTYHYDFGPDGSIVLTSAERLDAVDAPKIVPPRHVADSLTAMLTMAAAPERTSGKSGAWSPGPLAPAARPKNKIARPTRSHRRA